jgi:SAM-dependent methyltransferase
MFVRYTENRKESTMKNFDWLLDLPTSQGVKYFAKHLSESGFENADLIYKVSQARIIDLKNNTQLAKYIPGFEDLEVKWYESLRDRGQPDYSIYESDAYLAEAWACWAVYSRKYLLEIPKEKFLEPYGVAADMQPVTKIVDLGCGIAYSTAAIKRIFPTAEVIGTQLPDSKQYALAQTVAEAVGFSVVGSIAEVGKADAIFASEYFEHFEQPIEHLIEVLEVIQPRTLLIANAFGPDAPGHFDFYTVDGERKDSRATAKAFSNTLKRYGYEKVKTKFWNNRPNYWRKIK